MARATREIRRRIRSITSTRKVTKAMELVSSAKMRRAVSAVLGTRPYAQQAWGLLTNLAGKVESASHPLLRKGAGKKIGVILISSNRGLVGGFNTQLIQSVVAAIRRQNVERADIVLYGRKGRLIVSKYGFPASADFEKLDVVTDEYVIRPLSRLIIADYMAGKYDRVVIAYTDFVSMLVQKPTLKQLLPLQQEPGINLGSVGWKQDRIVDHSGELVFEPNPDMVLETLLPRLVEMQLYQAVLESNASEHAARMVTMRNASDAAADLIDDLTLTYNQARQAAITQDLSEISASRLALGS